MHVILFITGWLRISDCHIAHNAQCIIYLNQSMSEEDQLGCTQSALREFMEKHRELTLEQCLREFNRTLKEKVDATFDTNV